MDQLINYVWTIGALIAAGMVIYRLSGWARVQSNKGFVAVISNMGGFGLAFVAAVLGLAFLIPWGTAQMHRTITSNAAYVAGGQALQTGGSLIQDVGGSLLSTLANPPQIAAPQLGSVSATTGDVALPLADWTAQNGLELASPDSMPQFTAPQLEIPQVPQAVIPSVGRAAPADNISNLVSSVIENGAAVVNQPPAADAQATALANIAKIEADIQRAAANATVQAQAAPQNGPVQQLQFGNNGQIITGREDQKTGPVQALRFDNRGQLSVQPAATPTPHTYLYMVDGNLVTAPEATAIANRKQSAAAQAQAQAAAAVQYAAQQATAQAQQVRYAQAAAATATAVSGPVQVLTFDSSGQIEKPQGEPTAHAMLYMVDGNLVYAPEATAIAERKNQPGPVRQLANAGQ